MAADEMTGQPPDTGMDEADAPAGAPVTEPLDPTSWSNLWQVPTIAISLVLIVVGVWLAIARAPRNDFDGALDQVDRFIADGELDAARDQLHLVIEPSVDQATEPQRARFKALVADYIYFRQMEEGVQSQSNNLAILEHYEAARALGLPLDPARLERWALAAIETGDLVVAEERMQELEALSLADGAGQSIRRRRNHVLRSLVESTLARPDLPYETMLKELTAYRNDDLLEVDDELWVVAALARLRLGTGRNQDAVNHLLIDARRIENRWAGDPRLNFGEIQTLLARGYFALGRPADAAYHLQQALGLFRGPEPVRGEALVLLGHLALADGDVEEANDDYDQVVRDFPSESAYLPALLGRAETRGILGDDPRSQEDYLELVQRLQRTGPRLEVSPVLVVRSLLDRHDAALAQQQLEIALGYVEIARRLFDSPATRTNDLDLSVDVLQRLAALNRQIAENLLADAGAETDSARLDLIDPAVRAEAQDRFRRAGDASLILVRTLAGLPGEDERWGAALWDAAVSYDRAGDPDQAARLLNEFVSGRPESDAWRPRALARLARVYASEESDEQAAQTFEQLIADHPASLEGMGSFVPLARIYERLGRTQEAVQLLQQVLSGSTAVDTDASDYRDALIEIGVLFERTGSYAKAIERLSEALDRYPDHPRVEEVRFRLALSHRGYARGLQEQRSETQLSPTEDLRLQGLQRDSWRQAMALFATVKERLERRSETPLTFLEKEMLLDAYRYEADCAMDLGEYEDAIALYESVVRTYGNHHASMNAMVQIIDCYLRLGDEERASAAHLRAMMRLRQMPDSVFDDPDALMDRDAWERWLRNSPPGSGQLAATTPN